MAEAPTTESDTVVTAPDPEEYHVIIDALSRAKTTLHSLRVHRALELEAAPEGSGDTNLLEFLTKGQGHALKRGARLTREIQGAKAQVAVLETMLDEYNAREEAARAVS